jgi:hypothetical protein
LNYFLRLGIDLQGFQESREHVVGAY